MNAEAERERLVGETCAMLRHLARMRDAITEPQAFMLAEAARDAADQLDRGEAPAIPLDRQRLLKLVADVIAEAVARHVRPLQAQVAGLEQQRGRLRYRRLVRSERHDYDGSPLFKITTV